MFFLLNSALSDKEDAGLELELEAATRLQRRIRLEVRGLE